MCLFKKTTDTPNTLWKCIKDSLTLIIKDHVPTKYSSSSINQPWLNSKTKKLVRKKKKLFKKLKTCDSNRLRSEFQELKTETQK